MTSITLPGDDRYDPKEHLLQSPLHSPGYHTKVPDGTLVHDTRGSLGYALALLRTADPARHQRAVDVIRRILTLQDADPASKTYGIWPWLMEEPLPEMAAPDHNWADFLGALEVEILADHAAKLPAELVPQVRASLSHACRAIVKRNVTLDYTNIAIMGAGVTAAAGEVLAEPAFLAFGKDKLHRFRAYSEAAGGFSEYNSPTYTLVALHEVERILHLVKDEGVRADAEALRVLAWKQIAEHFHPGTAQWAGPHSRAYRDRLDRGTWQYFADQTGQAIGAPAGVAPAAPGSAHGGEPWFLPCPPEFRARFAALPQDPLLIERTFRKGATAADSLRGTTWLTKDACLGSVNEGTFWTQARPVLGYWGTDAEPAVTLRVRFLHDVVDERDQPVPGKEKDFSSAAVSTVQRGPRLLAAVRFVAGRGDFHPSLDKPAGGKFGATDFRLRVELAGKGVTAKALGEGVFELAAGEWRAVVHPIGRDADGQPMAWRLGQAAGGEGGAGVHLDGLYYHGPKRVFDLTKPGGVFAALGLELLRADLPPVTAVPAIVGDKAVTWEIEGGMHAAAP